MQAILAFAFWALGLLVCLYVAYRYLARKDDFFTGLHLFLAGLVFFQIINSAPVMREPFADEYTVQHPVESGMIFLGWNVLFLVTLLLAYHKGLGAIGLASRIRLPEKVPTDVLLLFCTPLLIAFAFVLRAVNINYVAALTSILGLALASAAAGISGWTIARNVLNPVYYAVGLPVMAAAAYIAGIGEFSRRPLLSVAIAIGWGIYYGRLRYLKPLAAAPYVAAAGLGGILLIGAHTIGGRNLGGIVQFANPGAATEAFESVVVSDYATARYAIWLIDQNYMLDREFKLAPFQSIWYTFAFPIPRALWDKPYPVSTYVADWADRQGVKRGRGGVTSPVGTVGNGAAEGGTIAVIAYAIFFAFLLRLFDQIIKVNPNQPLVILAIGSAMGQCFGVPRGETAVLVFNWLFGTAGTLVILTLMTKVIARYLPAATRADQPQHAAAMTAATPTLDNHETFAPPEAEPSPYRDFGSGAPYRGQSPPEIEHQPGPADDKPLAEADFEPESDHGPTPNFGAIDHRTSSPPASARVEDDEPAEPRLDWGARP